MRKRIRYIFLLSILNLIFSAPSLFSQDLEVVKLSSNQFRFVEGPAWDGHRLYFSDLNASKIFRHTPGSGFTEFINNPFSTNGIVYRDGLLYICESGAGRVISIDTLGDFQEIFARNYDDKSLNSPNDLCLDEQNGIYFTDPAFGFNPIQPESVYYISPEMEVNRILSHQTKPNGILYSEQKKRIFISDTYHRFIYSYDVSTPGVIGDTIEFAELKIADFREDDYSGADGMTFDKNGYLYVATESGIQVFDDTGNPEYIIEIPETPTNCTFGGENLDELYITAQKNIYRVKLDLNLNAGNRAIKKENYNNYLRFEPVTSTLFFSGMEKPVEYMIFSMKGSLLVTGKANPGENKSVQLMQGIYLIQVTGNGFQFTEKLLVPAN